MVGNDSLLRKEILQWLHASASGEHLGVNATIKRVKAMVYWKGLNGDIKHFIQRCTMCQQNKSDTAASPGLLQPFCPFLKIFGIILLWISLKDCLVPMTATKVLVKRKHNQSATREFYYDFKRKYPSFHS